MKKLHCVGMIVFLGMICLLSSQAYAQQAGKKEFAFRGKVEKVDANAKSLLVKNDNIPGWMNSMSMTYTLDNPDVLKQLKVGDQITAKVYEGDFKKLYAVQVAAPAK